LRDVRNPDGPAKRLERCASGTNPPFQWETGRESALTALGKRRLTGLCDASAMFVQLHLPGLSRTALLISGLGAMMLALLASAGAGAV